MKDVRDVIKLFKEKKVILFDSAMGTALMTDEEAKETASSEEANLKAPAAVLRVHEANVKAGSDVLTTNTFGVTPLLLRGETELAMKTLEAGVRLAMQAASESLRKEPIIVALGLGPSGQLLGPLGRVSYEEAGEAFAAQTEAGIRAGADFVLIETLADLEEFSCAVKAAKSVTDLPVIGTMSFNEQGRTYMGASVSGYVQAAREAGAAAIGVNCSLMPAQMEPVVGELLALSEGLPVIAQPNAGQPSYKDGKSCYDIGAESFTVDAEKLLSLGISAIGGCCGTTPEMIAELRSIIDRKYTGIA